jgi:aryl-phospho-beta-D-glucosidase BglC (GH1 family)
LSYVEPNLNADLLGKTPLQVLDLWMAEADRQGMYIMLDFHSVSMQRQYPTWFVSNPADFGLMYNKQAYTKENWTRDLAFVAQRYGNLPHFFAIDIYNEPEGVVRWSTGDVNAPNPANFWKPAAELASAAVLAANPNLLIFVQGINGNWDGIENTNVPMNWGEDFQPQAYQPLNIPNDKLVLSPHTYGPDVFMKSSFNAYNFPANLAANWDILFGRFFQIHPVVVGEWGGKYGQGAGGPMDVTWQNAFVDYLISKGVHNSFYWCYTPNSGDTGGILDDSLNVRTDKLALLQRLWGVTAGTPVPVPKPTPTTPPPTPTPAPAPAPMPVPGYLQPTIMNFTPASGPVGTVVTLNGTGFTGSNLAWAGNAHNATVNVLSDKQVQVTIPAGATTGAIGIFNPNYAAFTASAFTVSTTAATYTQPMIMNFSPQTGPVGTVVTLTGNGFTGLTVASVGAARNVPVKVISDSQVQVTIPPGSTTAAIGLFNPSYTAFTPRSFAIIVTATTTASNGQQVIMNFSPSSGPVGTVVTLNGRGFTGSNLAWVGLARNVPVKVVSDTQVQVTIPAGATTGAIGIFNPGFVAFSATSFTVR